MVRTRKKLQKRENAEEVEEKEEKHLQKKCNVNNTARNGVFRSVGYEVLRTLKL